MTAINIVVVVIVVDDIVVVVVVVVVVVCLFVKLLFLILIYGFSTFKTQTQMVFFYIKEVECESVKRTYLTFIISSP